MLIAEGLHTEFYLINLEILEVTETTLKVRTCLVISLLV
jgi:hypothetical protein